MAPETPLPYNIAFFSNTEDYISSLLTLITTHDLLRTLCGGVHVLDFFTSDPDLYSRLLPQEWRDFFSQHEILDLLDFFMREDLDLLSRAHGDENACGWGGGGGWRNGPAPPDSLLEYLATVRKHLLLRELPKSGPSQCARNRAQKRLPHHVSVGMSVKKVHEVGLFASYVDSLASSLSTSTPTPTSTSETPASTLPQAKEWEERSISHIVDFGSGQSYLGRALASPPYERSIVAIESKPHNAERAKDFDVKARLVAKKWVWRDKKAFRAGRVPPDGVGILSDDLPAPTPFPPEGGGERQHGARLPEEMLENFKGGRGRIQYVEHAIQDGDLGDVISRIDSSSSQYEPHQQQHGAAKKKNLMVISLHSCGNLVHHGLRSLILNPEVKAVAMVGCCYNLLTSRLGPRTYKVPGLLPPRQGKGPSSPAMQDEEVVVEEQEGRGEENPNPHGFPMSARLCNYTHNEDSNSSAKGINLNITALSLAVQSPQNWSQTRTPDFLTRHFYRALLQLIFLDHGVVGPPEPALAGNMSAAGHTSSGGTPILIGSLRKACYSDFVAYVRGALEKLEQDPVLGPAVREKMRRLTDEAIAGYEERLRERKKDLSVLWALMAFSAGVVEAVIVVDRWLWLREQMGGDGEGVLGEAWVEVVFDYGLSPRNLVVVGVKK